MARRPVGLLLLAAILLWMAAANVWRSLDALAYSLRYGPHFGTYISTFQLAKLVIGLAAALAAVGLWREARWAYAATTLWALLLLGDFLVYPLAGFWRWPNWWEGLGLFLGALGILGAVTEYVRRRSRPAV